MNMVKLKQVLEECNERVREGRCPVCGEPATGFRDELSRKEFTISGLCQKCQDSVFGEVTK